MVEFDELISNINILRNCSLHDIAYMYPKKLQDVLSNINTLYDISPKDEQSLIEPSIYNKPPTNRTILMQLCIDSDYDLVDYIFRTFIRSLNINVKNNKGTSAIMYACKHGHLDIIELMLKQYNLHIYDQNNKGYNAFMYACKYDHLDVIKLLKSKDKISDSPTKDGCYPFKMAVCRGNTNIVKELLIKYKHKCDLYDKCTCTEDNKQIYSPFNTQDKNFSILNCAINYEYHDIVEILLNENGL